MPAILGIHGNEFCGCSGDWRSGRVALFGNVGTPAFTRTAQLAKPTSSAFELSRRRIGVLQSGADHRISGGFRLEVLGPALAGLPGLLLAQLLVWLFPSPLRDRLRPRKEN